MPNKPLTRLLFVQGGLCFFCEKPLPLTEASVEHLVASSNGGTDRDENCVACCKSLNNALGSMSLKEKIQVFLKHKRPFECPNGTQKKATKTSQRKQPKLAAERYAQVVANLKQRGKAKPGTVARLKNTIGTLFHNESISPAEVDALVQELQTRRVISITGSKVTYA